MTRDQRVFTAAAIMAKLMAEHRIGMEEATHQSIPRLAAVAVKGADALAVELDRTEVGNVNNCC